MKNKSRLLYLKDYLETQTDEQHSVTVLEIIENLRQAGFPCCWNTLIGDIEQLMDSGVDIVCNKGRELKYFVGVRHFEMLELKLLVDAIQASTFISLQKTGQLISKLMNLTSVHQTEELNRHLYIDKKTKTTNECVIYTMDLLHTAICEKKKIIFKYYEYDQHKNKVYKHDGKLYMFSPYSLVWNIDCYYIIGYSDNHNKVIKFRVDRIAEPGLYDEAAIPVPKDFDINIYVCSVFQMYDGDEQEITLKCENALMKYIIDRFGEDVKTDVLDEDHFYAYVRVSVSPTFYGWVFGFSGRMEVIIPKKISCEYAELAHKIAKKARENT